MPKQNQEIEEESQSKLNFRGALLGLSLPGSPWKEAALVLILITDLFCMAAVLTPWTGQWGRLISAFVLGRVGGAVLLPELFVAYLVLSELFCRRVPGLFKQAVGTLFLFLCTALLFGLMDMEGNPFPLPFARGGVLGDGMARFLMTNLGALGTFLCGFALVVLAWLFLCPEQGKGLLSKLRRALRAEGLRKARSFSLRGTKGKGHSQQDNLPLSDVVEPLDPVSHEVGGVETEAESEVRRVRSGFPDCTEAESAGSPPPAVRETGRGESDPTAGERAGDLAGPSVSAEPEMPDVVMGTDNLQSHFEKESSEAGQDTNMSDPQDDEGLVFPPPPAIFGPPPDVSRGPQKTVLEKKGFQIISTLAEFGIEAELAEMMVGPTVIQYRIQLAPGIKVSRVAGLSNDLAVALAVPSLRVEAPIPGKPFVGVEIPNPVRQTIPLRQIIEEDNFIDSDYDLPLPVGACVDGAPLVIGLEDLPHLLVAGTTGSGKSVFVNSCIVGLCASRPPRELRLILVDPKRVEMSFYEKLPHTLHAPIVDAKKAIHALAWAVREMERRYELFASTRVRNLAGYNGKADPKNQLPHIVIVVDELADLMMTSPKEVEDYICRLAQMARATGIHLLLATQRPSVNVITGLIKANVPARVAFTLPSQADSRTIIDVSGAERLLGKGDMLFLSPRFPKAIRVQSPWIEENRILAFIDYLVRLFGEPEHIDIEAQSGGGGVAQKGGQFDDPLLKDAVQAVLNTGIASASRLQRQLRVGFTRAARLVDAMEDMGIVGPPDGSKPREILVDDDRAEELLDEAFGG